MEQPKPWQSSSILHEILSRNPDKGLRQSFLWLFKKEWAGHGFDCPANWATLLRPCQGSHRRDQRPLPAHPTRETLAGADAPRCPAPASSGGPVATPGVRAMVGASRWTPATFTPTPPPPSLSLSLSEGKRYPPPPTPLKLCNIIKHLCNERTVPCSPLTSSACSDPPPPWVLGTNHCVPSSLLPPQGRANSSSPLRSVSAAIPFNPRPCEGQPPSPPLTFTLRGSCAPPPTSWWLAGAWGATTQQTQVI